MEELELLCANFLNQQNFDCLAFGLFDFETQKFQFQQLKKSKETIDQVHSEFFFDLASVTKPLVMGLSLLKYKDQISEDLKALVEHRAGLPAWGLLSKDTWRDQLKSYEIDLSAKTLYSDFSALRFLIDIEAEIGHKLQTDIEQEYTDIYFWKELGDRQTPDYGLRGNQVIMKQVHDPNAFTIGEFCSHAGLFATPESLVQAVFTLEKNYDLLNTIGLEKEKELSKRFISGWDTITDLETTLAGDNASRTTFGHLGFVGNHIWIDPKRKKGHFVLSNYVKNHWYNGGPMRAFRREFGTTAWSLLDKIAL